MRFQRSVLACSFAVAIAVLAGCGSGHDKASTQLAAKVNGDEISVHQVNFALSSIPGAPGLNENQAKEAQKQVLAKLIDQQVLIQKAIEKKLDRDPRVQQAIDSARRQILAKAYLEQLVSGSQKPSAKDVAEFYDKHPELFKERRIYQFQELQMPNKPELATKLQQMLKAGTSAKDIALWLRDQKVQFNAVTVTKAAEEVPLELLQTFHKMKDGQIVAVPNNQAIAVEQLVESKTVPLDQKQATPFIERYLENQKKMQLAQSEVKQLRETAKVEYMGDFGKPSAAPATPAAPAPSGAAAGGAPSAAATAAGSAPPTDVAAPAANPAPVAAPPAAAAPAPASGAPAQKDDKTFMDKGLQGLK